MSLYELRPILTTREVGWLLGMTLGAISYGVLLTLSSCCIRHLYHTPKASVGDGFWKQHRVFQGYIVLILALNTVLQVDDIGEFTQAIFYTDPNQLNAKFRWVFGGILVCGIIMLTDGLLVSVSYHR